MAETLRNNEPAVPKAWPFEEAVKVARRLAASGKDQTLFETGYGPSGLPHIGTFGEVARTTWVRHAFSALTGLPSRLIAFSDSFGFEYEFASSTEYYAAGKFDAALIRWRRRLRADCPRAANPGRFP
jgi:lysyl-tRNA synthetase, class I